MKNTITVTIKGKTGTGKSILAAKIRDMLKKEGIDFIFLCEGINPGGVNYQIYEVINK